MNDEEQLELDIPEPEENLSEEGLEEDIKRNEERRQKEYDEATKGNEEIRRLREARRGTGAGGTQLEIPGLFKAQSGFRRTAALGTEVFLNTLVDPFFEPGTQVAAGTAINFLAQRIRGGEISKGELAASGLASLIPGAAQGRAITQFAKGTGKGALSGVIETAGIAGIDRGEVASFEELAAGAGVGAAFGGIVSAPQAAKALRKLRNRIQGKKEKFARFTPDDLEEMGIGQAMESRFADELTPTTASSLENELDTRAVAGTYGFSYTKVSSKPRNNRYGIPKDISTIYLNHADAYKAAMGPDDTLELFPTLIWNNKRYRPKSRGKGQGVSFEDFLDRQTRRKITNERRRLAVWKQTRPGVKPGTFYREKLKQLRKLNTEEATLGLPEKLRTKLRDVDMDHKNALRSVEDYTEGLTEPATNRVYNLMEKGGLFTGDDSRNLILRNRMIHKNLWPKMKKALKALGHKRRKDFRTQTEYLRYLTRSVNPKTGDTPLQEYIDTINFIEEQATDEALNLLTTKVRQLYFQVPGAKRTATYRRLSEILGGDENVDALIRRLQRDEVPRNIQPDLLEGEFAYIGRFGQVSPSELDDIIDEITK
mgnify:CR=1 FL=1